MDSRKIVMKETAIVAVGEVLCTAAMVGVFVALGKFGMSVLWGAVAGCAVSIFNHFFLAVAVNLAADRAEQGDVAQAQKMIRNSSALRFATMIAVLLVGIFLKANVLALLLPLLFVRPILMLSEFFRKKGDA
jgi:hypothetical protein